MFTARRDPLAMSGTSSIRTEIYSSEDAIRMNAAIDTPCARYPSALERREGITYRMWYVDRSKRAELKLRPFACGRQPIRTTAVASRLSKHGNRAHGVLIAAFIPGSHPPDEKFRT